MADQKPDTPYRPRHTEQDTGSGHVAAKPAELVHAPKKKNVVAKSAVSRHVTEKERAAARDDAPKHSAIRYAAPKHVAPKHKARGKTVTRRSGGYNDENKKKRWPRVIAVSIATILIAGGVTYLALQQLAVHRDDQRRAGYLLIDEAIALIQESDAIVVSLDQTINSQVTNSALPQLQALLNQVPSARNSLTQALEKAQQADALFSEQRDHDFVQIVFNSIEYRQILLDDGTQLIGHDITAMNCLILFDEAWNSILEADSDMREAAEHSASGNYTRTQLAISLNHSAQDKLTYAQQKLRESQELYDSVNYEVIFVYLETKKESAIIAEEADRLFIDGYPTESREKNEEFIEIDAMAVAAASRIPNDPTSLITSVYDLKTAQVRGHYQRIRGLAVEADTLIRDYVGIDVQTGIQ